MANEVKELAKKTAKATEDISRKIETIQIDAKAAVDSIGTISEVINQINGISSTIATGSGGTERDHQRDGAQCQRRRRTAAEKLPANIAGVAEAAESTSRGAPPTLRKPPNS